MKKSIDGTFHREGASFYLHHLSRMAALIFADDKVVVVFTVVVVLERARFEPRGYTQQMFIL